MWSGRSTRPSATCWNIAAISGSSWATRFSVLAGEDPYDASSVDELDPVVRDETDESGGRIELVHQARRGDRGLHDEAAAHAGAVVDAWKSANAAEQVFLVFCMAFREVSGEPTQTETDYWDVALDAEAIIRGYLVENKIQIVARSEFDLSVIADGMLAGTKIRTLQAHYGISLCGSVFQTHVREACERKYQKAIQITERLAMIGSSARDNLPYFNAAEHQAARSAG